MATVTMKSPTCCAGIGRRPALAQRCSSHQPPAMPSR